MIQSLVARPVTRSLVAIAVAFGYGWLTGRLEAPEDPAVFWIGNLAAPYLIIGLAASAWAARNSTLTSAAVGGLSVAATVAGFYNLPGAATATQLSEGLAPDAPRQQAIAQALTRWLSLNMWGSRPWLTIGVVTGLTMGLLGYRWRTQRSLLAWYVAAAALVVEPLVYVTSVNARIGLGWAYAMTVHNMLIWSVEFLLGLTVLAATYFVRAHSLHGQGTPTWAVLHTDNVVDADRNA